MSNLINNFKNLGTGRLIALGVLVATIMAIIIFSFSVITKPVMNTIYSGLDPSESANIVSALEQNNIPVNVSPDGSVVEIPRDDFAKARMLLASAGLPKTSGVGWELFDTTSALGMTSFMQRVNKLRALEGELARSIQTIDKVEAARVHLVLPEREAFSRERPEPSASVIIRQVGNYSMDKPQAIAIRNLVASAVPELQANKITVLSATGEMILSEESDNFSSDVTMQSMKDNIESRYARSIESILSARVGAGNVRVNVNVDLNTERAVTVSESFDPNQQVVRSTETTEEIEESNENDQSDVSVANNLPNANGTNSGSNSQNTRSRTDEVVNYEIGTIRTEKVKEPGDVENISVAVLVNGIYNVQDSGEVEYEERPVEEIERLNELVKSAIGYSEQRGDQVSVESLRFMDYSMEVGDPLDTGIMYTLSQNIMSIIQWIAAIILTTLVLLLGVRPLLTSLFPQSPTDTSAEITDDVTSDETTTASVVGDNGQPNEDDKKSGITVVVDDNSSEDEDDFIDIDSVEGGVRKKKIDAIARFVEQDTEEALKVLRGWIGPDL